MPTVFVNKRGVGSLTRGIAEAHLFTYDRGVAPGNAVSLLMPTPASQESPPYAAERPTLLHPVFDQNLPEGALREAISRMFAKALPIFDDFALLEIVGRSLIGRLRFAASPADLEGEMPTQNIAALLKAQGTAGLFRDLLDRYARYSGISGVQPKLLVRDDGTLLTSQLSPPIRQGTRLTYPGSTHIIKGFDTREYPDIAANEFACLQAARASGLPTPNVMLANDGGLLVIERFDLKPDGSYLGFEDLCSLSGRHSREKYEGSYEQVVKTLKIFLSSPQGIDIDLRNLFKSLVLSVVVRNGDAHRKNFGVLYDAATESPVALAPTYDVLTTTPYVAGDTMALTLDGSKRWPGSKGLVRFGMNHCQLREVDAELAIEEVANGVARARNELERIANKEIREKVRNAWEEGLANSKRG
ncbi:MAG: type II toxin-antitoxin system HipA family toxin [Opitutaceae bacterium]|jgi:serine/threonine-protein kinase HipA